ncbi:S41 family peptidase [Zymomonas mobilis]|uniref:S41 family peptidase n=1 Tax=Zymomonas mobilis TaxID=542 RepID=UPI0003C7561D|nr:S41 family peptidase [Zymomonas mobilis]AHB10775.1 C-terminal processing peptidase-3 [Zymomonas mobilis subsp. mobilis str. CP4 = NRRL B-14023]AHJ71087.1 Carboxy-terminal processing protease CtpB precursor [Zymomonas mobilis subsp. mobilis NRRL B-12526]AHJ72940.1 Carboxy-terminal processing protease CtpB precursor [Zymomonas mobilis subsp. mobilis str. CP4 = NRRL B-14023]TWE26151.1 carboxyl-terminal processing protease [Zymomonas mobilis]
MKIKKLRLPLLMALASTGMLIPALTSSMAAVDSQNKDTYHQLDQFMRVFEQVKSSYVDKVDDQKLIQGAIDGMLSNLDPHSSYMNAHQFANIKTQADGNYGGLGLTVMAQDGILKVISPMKDTPSWRAGLKAGDYITHIDGQFIYGSNIDDSVSKMRGKPGTSVKLTVVRPGRDKEFDVTLTREIIQVQSVKWAVTNHIGVITVSSFSHNVGADVTKAIADIEKQNKGAPLGYILDLRSNPGGLLDQAVALSDIFLDHGEVVSERGREKTDIRRYFSKPGDLANGLPLIVLVDGGSASASEIVSGALQDHHRALIMGTRSFGKGSVQTLLPLGDDTALRLTTARYYTPSGRSVQEGGIEPDIIVPQLSDPDYKTRPKLREADLLRHLVNQANTDNSLLEDDNGKTDPQFTATPESLKKENITDFQLDYALKTIGRISRQPSPITKEIPAGKSATSSGRE